MISVLNVTKHFDEVHALSEVDLDIATGEFITIVGLQAVVNLLY